MMSTFFFLTQFLQDVRGFGALATGLAFLPMAAGMFTMTRLVPRLLHRFGPRPLAVTGSVLMMGGLAWLTQLSPTSGYTTAILGPMVILGVGGGLGFIPLTPVIMATVEPQDTGAAGGVLQTMQQLGSSLGLAILVTVFGTVAHNTSRGQAPSPELAQHALVSGMTTAFAAATIFAACTAAVALTFRPTPRT
jgi:MFS family permease